MSQDLQRATLQRAIEEIKLRAPIEDVVREYVADLKKRGRLWEACCPFHSEKTPSFKVDPAKGRWHCYGSCSEGGDQITFIERVTGLSFWEALSILADRTQVELPRKGRGRSEERGENPAYSVLRRAGQFYRDCLDSPEGAETRDYLARRGLSEGTLAAFGVGFAPASGQALCDLARRERLPFELLEGTGLARKNDRGRAYDFFRGRLMIPIRDVEGRTVGFGARRLGEGDGPKYINTAETELFKKGRLIYGLDLALREARLERHLILVEGYTDVMAAHQAGLERVGAVLGTSTTDDHARLVRRSGAQRVSLVFDGDEAGRRAARRALFGLLPLELELEVVNLPQGEDPCDLLVGQGAEAFLGRVEAGQGWFEHELEGLEGLSGVQLSQEVDELLQLLQRLPRVVHRRSLFTRLAAHLGLPEEALMEQWQTSSAGRRRSRPQVAPAPEPTSEPAGPTEPAPRPLDPCVRRAFAEMLGAVLLDSSLVPLVRPYVELCQDQGLAHCLGLVLEMYEDVEAEIGPGSLLTALADHPARSVVGEVVARAETASSPLALLEGAQSYLNRRRLERQRRELQQRASELEQRLFGVQGEERRLLEEELAGALAELVALTRREITPSEPQGSSLSHSVD